MGHELGDVPGAAHDQLGVAEAQVEKSAAYSADEMACCHPSQTLSPLRYTDTWLIPHASPGRFHRAYASSPSATEDMFKTGVWAPILPIHGHFRV